MMTYREAIAQLVDWEQDPRTDMRLSERETIRLVRQAVESELVAAETERDKLAGQVAHVREMLADAHDGSIVLPLQNYLAETAKGPTP